MALNLDEGVIYLIRRLLHIPAGARILLPALDRQAQIPKAFLEDRVKITAFSNERTEITEEQARLGSKDYYNMKRYEVSVHEHLQMFQTVEEFHYAFLQPAAPGVRVINDNGTPVLVNDYLRYWNVSRHYHSYTAPLHSMLLESMQSAILPGGYFAAILPQGWLGAKMRYNKRFQESACTVAKIKLPEESLTRWLQDNDDLSEEWENVSTGNSVLSKATLTQLPEFCHSVKVDRYPVSWSLYIWHKTAQDVARSNALFPATRRYSTFAAKLKTLGEEDINSTLAAFRKHDWYKYSIRPWLKIMEDSADRYAADPNDAPTAIASPSEMRIVQVSEKSKPTFSVYPNMEAIKARPLAAHIKLGPPAKVYAYTGPAIVALQDLQERLGIPEEEKHQAKEDYLPKFKFELILKSRSIIENREWLLSNLCNAGLEPCLLEQEAQRMRQQERWLDIQLTPIERTVRVPSADNGSNWEKMYDDTGVRAIHPEVYQLWEKRAKKMKLNSQRWTFPFQFEDIVLSACKQSIWNTNQMGLGKTRELLFVQLLRCAERSLIISPSRLVGIWQDEIEQVIANYVRAVGKNWMGKVMHADYQVIEYAKHCLPENLKTFNIISYENMGKVPKDAMFFKCPVCEFITCSPFGQYREECRKQICPRCSSGIRKKWQEQCKQTKLRKYYIEGGEGERQDDRPPMPPPVYMLPQENQFDKLVITVKQQERYNREKREFEMFPVETRRVKKVHLKWTFSNLLRNSMNFRMAEESNYVNNPTANRSVAMNHGRARTRIAATGTPVRGYPRSVVNVINWIFKRDVLPDYRSPGNNAAGMKKFERKYGYYVEREGKSKRLMPKLNQPEMFQQEMAPLMIRHIRSEPEVAKSIPPKVPEINNTVVPMDDEHRAYYNLWLEKFAEWWQLKRMEEDEQDNAKVVNDLLVKLGYLINVSSIPHFMLENLSGEGALWASIIGEYKGKNVVAKFSRCQQMIERHVEEGDKSIVFTWRRANLVLGRQWCKAHTPPIHSIHVDGTISNKREEKYGNRSEKDWRVDKFRHKDYNVLWAGIQTMKEGFNIPEANRGIFLEYTWEPADWQQALARMLRPAQKKQVHGTFLCHQGTVDEYIASLVQIKARSALEGVDFQDYSDFKVSDIPDFQAYANAILDGTTDVLKTRMWNMVDELKKEWDEGDGGGFGDKEDIGGNGGKGNDFEPPEDWEPGKD